MPFYMTLHVYETFTDGLSPVDDTADADYVFEHQAEAAQGNNAVEFFFLYH